ncbi:MAG: prolyl oligopeptidase family serine peptidase [Candidatus Aminicenantes bacterium]|nr:prolyl oligopeptidase family serine peptidase [Candidatus Aminicenantes bacterium]
MKRIPVIVLLVCVVLATALGAQTKPPATFADFGKWESLAPAGARGGFSPDGRWLAYAINRSNRENELRIVKLADGTTKIAAFGAQPAYSADSKWLAYSIGRSEAEQEKLRSEQKPVQNKLGLLNLTTGEMSTVEGIESFTFSSDGAYLAMQRYAPARPSSGSASSAPGGRSGVIVTGGADSADERPGTTLLIRHLADGRDTTFGNVSQFAWQDAERSHLLAMIISAEGKTGNGVQVFDPATTSLRVLDSTPSVYSDLAWRKDAPDLAVFRAKTDERKDGPTQALLSWTELGAKAERMRTYDPTADASFPAGMRTVTSRRLSWSADGQTIFLGMANWDDKPVTPAKPEKGTDIPAAKETAERTAKSDASAAVDEPSTVEIWHARDVFVMPWQKINAASDRRRNLLAAWNLESGKLVPLGKDAVNEQVTPISRTNFATAAEWSKYAFARTIGRPAADLFLVDIMTGARTKLKENINDRYVQTSPGGKYLLFLQSDHFWTIDLATRAITNITKSAPVSFINKESDETIEQKPPFGVAGWTTDDAAVLLYDKYDLWKVAADGSKAQKLTSGAAEQVRHRLVRLDAVGGGFRGGRGFGPSAADQGIDLGKPQYLSLYGEWTKKSGYALLKPGGEISRLIWLDRGVGSLAKAKDAEIYGYVLQDYDVSPNIFVGGPDLKEAKPATKTNPFQSDYAWGRSELIEYKTDRGRRLQGALLYPAGYVPGKKYPMIVYSYELLSQSVHNYVAPSDRSYYNLSVFTSLGYLVLEPDIVFRPRQPGWSVVECITAGVRKVVQMGIVDPKRIGAVGHSMGGFNTAFMATNTNGVFAAAVAGAPIIDMVSYYGDHHWSSGIAETDHIETGQERMEVPLYEDLKDYIDNSPYFNTHNMTVPLLLEVGDQDGTVAWHQSIELYNVARRANKNVIMLAYMGEDHGLRQAKNQKDYQRRILAWFGHYLKGEPAEPWIVGGQSFLDREAEIKQQTTKK